MNLRKKLKIVVYEKEKQIEIDGKKIMYSITTYGKVYSLNYKHTGKKVLLKQNTDKNGYKTVTLYINSKPKTFKVHRLVCMMFVPNPDNKPFINHIDCCVSNNNITNLEWCTASENTMWALTHGNLAVQHGDNSPNHKYTEKAIKKVCKLLEKNTMTLKDISSKTNVPVATINAIKAKKQWTTISDKYKVENHNIKEGFKLNEEIVDNICKDIVNNELTLTQISHKYDVRLSVIQKIFHRKNWRHISENYDFSNYDRGSVKKMNKKNYKTIDYRT